MGRCRVKICGITSVEDALMVAEAGADAIGLVFYPPSKRYVTLEVARAISQALPPFVARVGLFVDSSAAEVDAILEQVALDVLQFHGSESPAYCRSFKRTYIKAVGMKGLAAAGGFRAYVDPYQDAQAILVDSHAPGAAGGTGETFDWQAVPKDYAKPIILAGGLQADNVAEAIRITGAYAVDVSSGVESQAGIKSAVKVHQFMQACWRSADFH